MTVVAIFGPTASGKSAVAEALAERVPAELVSADSMQAYRGLPILTNQPATPTRLVGIWTLEHEGSVAEYAELAHRVVDEALANGRTPVVVGGTGLYFRAALTDLGVPPEALPGARERLDALYERLGPEQAHALLVERDPAAAENVHPNDRRRVVRALELVEAGSSLRPAEDRLWSGGLRRSTLVVGLDVPREVLAHRIAARTRAMLEAGAAEEARTAAAGRLSLTAGHVIGLRELTELSEGEAAAAIELRTRRYAAYQRKWMRRIPELVPLDGTRPPGELADEIVRRAYSRREG
jgi:tRNA dimethylallyltransferase